MTNWQEALGSARAHFVEQLEQRGLAPISEARLTGCIQFGETTHRITVVLTKGFPFNPPSVYPDEEFPRSWHRELDGAMCIYPYAGRETLPWLDTDDFFASIRRWLIESEDGWTKDAPDLDLHRYFIAAQDDRLLVYDDLDPLLNRYIRLRLGAHTIEVLGPGVIPARTLTQKRRAFGFVTDIGELASPPQDWDQIAELLSPQVSKIIDSAVRDRRIEYLIVRYSRQNHTSVLALATCATAAGIELRALQSAHRGKETLTLRSGFQHEALRGKNVLIVGAGAVGSYLCDALTRVGIGHLTVRDYDLLRPGNLIRHLATPSFVGQPKVTAVRAIIHAQPYNVTTVTAEPTALTDPAEVPALLDRYDLVIDATADAAASAMLGTAARATRKHIVSVCLQEEGRVVRIDVIPPITGEPNPPTTSSIAPSDETYEAGCGDPVSMTPPFAVTEAASLAARHAVGLLTGTPLTPAGEVRDYR